MTYEEFKRELYRNLQRQSLPGRARVVLLEKGAVYEESMEHILRMVNVSDYGKEDVILREDILCVVWKRLKTVRILHWKVRTIYEQFKQEGWQNVLAGLVSKIRQLGEIDQSVMRGDYTGKCERLLLRPVHYPNIHGEEDNTIFWKFGDIALVLYLLVQKDAENIITMKLHREMAKDWNMTDDALLTNALLNTYAKMPPRLYYAMDIRSHYDDHYGVFMPGERGITIQMHPGYERERLHGYRLTTNYRCNGAVALFYPGVKVRLAELLGGDYYVGFTSIHEAVIHPVGHKVLHRVKEAIYRTNIVFDRSEMLSDRVYRYSCKRKELIEV